MKTLQDILSELEAVEKTELDTVVSAIDQAVADLQALAGAAPAADPIATIVATTVGGVSSTFVPQPASN